MITTALLLLFYYFIYATLSPLLIFPNVSLPSEITNAVAQASSSLHIVDLVIPVTTIVAIIVLFLSIEGSVFAYKLIKWVYTKIPGIT